VPIRASARQPEPVLRASWSRLFHVHCRQKVNGPVRTVLLKKNSCAKDALAPSRYHFCEQIDFLPLQGKAWCGISVEKHPDSAQV
jgi:hypothetical protein